MTQSVRGCWIKAGLSKACCRESQNSVVFFNTSCRLEALEKGKSSLETQLQTVISQLQTLELELLSNAEGLYLESRCLADILSV
uniref:Uncharacterized protein n=1 Tax=Manihot esculenta TaxID=3983 RepID=A0A2C9V592_MANES